MRIVIAALSVLLLTGCDGAEAPAPATGPDPVPTKALPPPSDRVAADGSSLDFMDTAGAVIATLGCGPDGLRIVVPGFRPIASEDRLSIGTDGEAYALVADLSAAGPGVTAAGVADPDLLEALARGDALFASYGQQSAGPLSAAAPEGLQELVSVCRARD